MLFVYNIRHLIFGSKYGCTTNILDMLCGRCKSTSAFISTLFRQTMCIASMYDVYVMCIQRMELAPHDHLHALAASSNSYTVTEWLRANGVYCSPTSVLMAANGHASMNFVNMFLEDGSTRGAARLC